MSKTTKCQKCSGKMRDGEVYINVTTLSGEMGGAYSMMSPYSPMSIPGRAGVSVEGPLWREYTGKEEGWLIKKKEQKKMSIKGKRCVECGYVELYVKEK